MRHQKFSSIGIDLTEQIHEGVTYKTNREIDTISVHCSFSPLGRGDDANTIDRWHKERFGSGIGYHYVVLEDGTIQKGRWVDYPGAGVKGHNKRSIHICRIGGKGKDGAAIKDATHEQIFATRKLAQLLVKMYELTLMDIKGHKEFPNVLKSCPLMNMNLIRNIV